MPSHRQLGSSIQCDLDESSTSSAPDKESLCSEKTKRCPNIFQVSLTASLPKNDLAIIADRVHNLKIKGHSWWTSRQAPCGQLCRIALYADAHPPG